VGRTVVTPISYSDTAIVLRVPAHAAGTDSVTVIPGPSASGASVSRADVVRYVAAIVRPAIVRVVSSTGLGHPTRSDFHPVTDLDDTFTLVGADLIGAGGVNPVDERNQKLNRRVTIKVRY
jgi:hypothetical protein